MLRHILFATAVVAAFALDPLARTLTDLLILAWGLAILAPRLTRTAHQIDMADALALAWLLWIGIAHWLSPIAELSVYSASALALLPAVFLLWRRSEPGEWIPYFWMLALAMAAWGLLEPLADTTANKPDGPLIDPNQFAGFLNLLWLPLLAAHLARSHDTHWREAARLGGFFLIAFVLFSVASRGATLALALTLPFLLIKAWREAAAQDRTHARIVLLLAVMAMAYGLSLWTPWQQGDDSLSRLADTLVHGDSARISLWMSSLSMILDAPLTGFGLGGFRLHFPRYRDPAVTGPADGWAHNDYLQVMVDSGLIGGILVLAILGAALLLAWAHFVRRHPHALMGLGWTLGAVAMLLQAGVNFMLYFPVISILLGMALAQGTLLLKPALPTRPFEMRPVLSKALVASVVLVALQPMLFAGVTAAMLQGDRPGLRLMQSLGISLQANTVAETMTALWPQAHHPHLILAQSASRRVLHSPSPEPEDLLRAQYHFAQARSLAPCFLPIHVAEAEYHLQLAQRGQDVSAKSSEQVLQAALACQPLHALSRFMLARALSAQGRFEEAQTLRDQGRRDSRLAVERLLFHAAWLYGRNGPITATDEARLTQAAGALLQLELTPLRRPDMAFWQAFKSEVKAREVGLRKRG